MHFVCIENNQITGIQSYEPAVPSTVSVITISDEQHAQIMAQTHRFDTASRTVVAVDQAIISQREQDRLNGIEREFLNSTDWKIMRHIRQKALNVATSLTDAEYTELEQQRQAAAARIV
jgi:heme A synthase